MSSAPSRRGPQGTARGSSSGWSPTTSCLLLLSPVLLLWLLWRLGVKRKGLGVWRHRLGLVPRPPAEATPRVWLHAVSAGEMGSIKPVLDGAARGPARGLPGGLHHHPGRDDGARRRRARPPTPASTSPSTGSDCMALALWRVRPHLVVVAEKELWPNLLGLARLYGMPTLVVNGRVSDRMMRRARRARGFVRWLYRLPACFCVQSEVDADAARGAGRSGRASDRGGEHEGRRDGPARPGGGGEAGAGDRRHAGGGLAGRGQHPSGRRGDRRGGVRAGSARSFPRHGCCSPPVTSRAWRRCRGG